MQKDIWTPASPRLPRILPIIVNHFPSLLFFVFFTGHAPLPPFPPPVPFPPASARAPPPSTTKGTTTYSSPETDTGCMVPPPPSSPSSSSSSYTGEKRGGNPSPASHTTTCRLAKQHSSKASLSPLSLSCVKKKKPLLALVFVSPPHHKTSEVKCASFLLLFLPCSVNLPTATTISGKREERRSRVFVIH